MFFVEQTVGFVDLDNKSSNYRVAVAFIFNTFALQ
jgi:hypothetical protein